MVTIQLPSPSDVSIDRLLRFLRSEDIDFDYRTDNEAAETTIRLQLTEKYVTSGQWATMSDDERQDAALLERLLLQQETPQKVYSVSESAQILADLKSELYADTTH